MVEQAIQNGRGKVRVGDTLWQAEGPDAPGRHARQGDGDPGHRAGGGACNGMTATPAPSPGSSPLVSMALPWLGVGLGVVGGWQVSRADPEGWWLVGAGAACLIADVVIDFVWAHPTVSKSDQPDLNRPAAQLVGRVLVVAEADRGRPRQGARRRHAVARRGPRLARRRRGQGDGRQGHRAAGGAGLSPLLDLSCPDLAVGESGTQALLLVALGRRDVAGAMPGSREAGSRGSRRLP